MALRLTRCTPVRRTLVALALLAAATVADSAVAQIYEIPPPDPAAQAATRRALLREEATLARRLAKTHGDPAVGARLGEALRKPADVRLDHPSAALRAAVLAARDPAALALAIAGDAGENDQPATYETDVLLLALSLPVSRPRQAELWAKAAEAVRRTDLPLRVVFLERAGAALSEVGAGTSADLGAESGAKPASRAPSGSASGRPPDRFAIASRELDELLGLGLAREAVAAFDALPADLRERLIAAGGGTTVDGYIRPDQRLSLAAARLLAGDEAGARAFLARVPVAAWRPADGLLLDQPGPEPAAVFRAMLERALAPVGGDDPFPVLAEFSATDLFGPSLSVWGAGVAAYARLAEREGYPAFAAFAWWNAPGDDAPAPPEPALLPPAAREMLRHLRAARAEQARLARAALEANLRAAAARPRPEVKSTRDGVRLDRHPHAILFALDREGRRGLVMLQNEPAYGELYRVEPKDGGLVGVPFGSWIS